MRTYILGIKPPNEEVNLRGKACYEATTTLDTNSKETKMVYQIDLTKLPEDIRYLQFVNSYPPNE